MKENLNERVRLIECPRDAMQGWKKFIPTEKKVDYINALLKVGFDTIDFGSFVSPEAIPQMADTREVLKHLDYKHSASKLLAIVVNNRSAEEAVEYEPITYLGYPCSISETFQLRNTHRTIAQSFEIVKQIQQLCVRHQKQLVIYISMGFGNPYHDPYNKEAVIEWVRRLSDLGISIISLADTVGVAQPLTISYLFSQVIPEFPEVEFGAHFHSTPHHWEEKIRSAYDNGCRRFDSAINGIGGCPMAEDELTGNVATENIWSFFDKRNIPVSLDKHAFQQAEILASEIFIQ